MSDAPKSPSVTVETSGNAVIGRVHVKMLEDKDLKQLGQLIDERAGNPGVSVVVFDMSKVTILPSLAIGVLVQILNKCRARQQKLKLAGLPSQVRQVLTITKIDRMIDLCDNVEDAVREAL